MLLVVSFSLYEYLLRTSRCSLIRARARVSPIQEPVVLCLDARVFDSGTELNERESLKRLEALLAKHLDLHQKDDALLATMLALKQEEEEVKMQEEEFKRLRSSTYIQAFMRKRRERLRCITHVVEDAGLSPTGLSRRSSNTRWCRASMLLRAKAERFGRSQDALRDAQAAVDTAQEALSQVKAREYLQVREGARKRSIVREDDPTLEESETLTVREPFYKLKGSPLHCVTMPKETKQLANIPEEVRSLSFSHILSPQP